MIKAVFFDFDGVLSDSKKAHDTAWIKAVEKVLNVKIDVLPSDKISGKAPKLIAKRLCELYGDVIYAEKLLACKNKSLINTLENIKPFEGVEAVFNQLKAKKISFGVASNASKYFVAQCLKNWNLEVAVCYGYEDYTQAKPNPEPYLKLANYFKINKVHFKDILVFEDSETGLKSAISAGMTPIHIKSYSKVSTKILNNINYSFESVLEASAFFKI